VARPRMNNHSSFSVLPFLPRPLPQRIRSQFPFLFRRPPEPRRSPHGQRFQRGCRGRIGTHGVACAPVPREGLLPPWCVTSLDGQAWDWVNSVTLRCHNAGSIRKRASIQPPGRVRPHFDVVHCAGKRSLHGRQSEAYPQFANLRDTAPQRYAALADVPFAQSSCLGLRSHARTATTHNRARRPATCAS